MQKVTEEQGKHILEALRWFDRRFKDFFLQILSEQIDYFQPTSEILNVTTLLEVLLESFTHFPTPTTVELKNEALPLLKRVLVSYRRYLATETEKHKAKTIHPDVISSLEAHVNPLDKLLEEGWLRDIEPMKLPNLTQYLSIEQLERILPKYGGSSKQTPLAKLLRQYKGGELDSPMVSTASRNEVWKQEYDEKFHILRAPNLFLQDLAVFRNQCEMRNTSVIIAYLDIDDFKSFNTEYTETTVDRIVLPPFMSAIESHTFAHGFAYRFGGDEYLILLLNMSFDIANSFLNHLRQDLSEVQYIGIDKRTTVSMGFCYIAPDCILTDQEALARANSAKQFAKKQGKNCVATFKDGNFDIESLYVTSK